MHWSANFKARCRVAVCPPPPAFRKLRTQSERNVLSSLSLRTSAHAGVAIRFPASRRLARPARGAMGVHDRPDDRCNAAHCLGTDYHAAALLAIIMCFRTAINERPRLSSARRSRRISCTGLPCRNPPARDPSPLAQDDMSGGRQLVHNNDGLGGGCEGTCQICRCPAGDRQPPYGADWTPKSRGGREGRSRWNMQPPGKGLPGGCGTITGSAPKGPDRRRGRRW